MTQIAPYQLLSILNEETEELQEMTVKTVDKAPVELKTSLDYS